MYPKPVLIVDDDPHIRKTLVDILTLKGYTPNAVETGEAAITSVTCSKPAVVVIELCLGDMSGLEVIKQIKALSSATECIVLTRCTEQRSAIEAVNLGVYSYLQKPYDPEQLLLVIHRAIEEQKTEQKIIKYRTHLETLVKQRTRELIEAKEIAEAAQTRAEANSLAKSQFLANMSHELRTPLNVVLGYTQMLKQAKNLTQKQIATLGTVHRSGEHLLTLITDILDISKIEAGKLELESRGFYLSGMLNNLIEMTRIRAELKSLTFHAILDIELPNAVSGDEKRLRQILFNLLGNAVKFTEQGRIIFRVKRLPLSSPSSQTRILFEVEDTGIGIPVDQLQRIFEPFQQVSDSRFQIEGTGLGLAISQQLVRQMGGELSVQSHIGQGTFFRFELVLPIVTIDILAAPPSNWSHVTGYLGQVRKVLLVDDKPENIRFLADVLIPLGFEIFTAENGLEALRMARRYRPDVVLMDVVMPEMDGLTATRQLRHDPETRNIVVIMISASAFEHDRQRSLNAGSDDFLIKPISLNDLLEKLRHHLSLEWEYEKARQQEPDEDRGIVIYPERETLLTLLELAHRGAPRSILDWLDTLEEEERDYVPFVAKIRTMAQGFDIEGICSLLEAYLENT